MTFKLLAGGILFLAVALELVADVLFKHWALTGKSIFIVVGTFLYLAATLLWAFSLKYQPLSKAIVVFTIGNLILGVIAGIAIFDESLTIIQKIGVIFGLLSIVMLEL